MKRCKKILLHICMICSSIDVMTMVLDYYNPYMNFGGAVRWMHLMLFGCLVLLLILPQPRIGYQRKVCYNSVRYKPKKYAGVKHADRKQTKEKQI